MAPESPRADDEVPAAGGTAGEEVALTSGGGAGRQSTASARPAARNGAEGASEVGVDAAASEQAPGGNGHPASSSRAPEPGHRKKREHASPILLRFRRSPMGRRLNRWVQKSVDIGITVFSVSMKIIGPCFALLALGLISFCVYTYFVYVLPLLGDDSGPGLAYRTLVTLFGLFLLFNTIYNYLKSMFMDAGTPPPFSEAKLSDLVDAGEELGQASPPKPCKKCGRYKPPRAHHCSVCNRCVLKMDHHCPWINNCVGFGNYRHFLLFLLYLASGCVFVFIVFLSAVIGGRPESKPSNDQWGSMMWATASQIAMQLASDSDDEGRQNIMFACMLACVIFIALSCLGGMHVYLLLTNQSTIEFQMNLVKRRDSRASGVYWRNPYDCGRRLNFQQVFGPNPFCRFRWLLPYIALPPEGDGMVFPSLWRLKA